MELIESNDLKKCIWRVLFVKQTIKNEDMIIIFDNESNNYLYNRQQR
jgi:hypothetical protein